MATGEIVGSFCLSEPEAGSDAASVRTTAVKDGDCYILKWHQTVHHQRTLGGFVHRLCSDQPLMFPAPEAYLRFWLIDRYLVYLLGNPIKKWVSKAHLSVM